MKLVVGFLMALSFASVSFAKSVECVVMDDNNTDVLSQELVKDKAVLDKMSSVNVRVAAEVSKGLVMRATVIGNGGMQAIAAAPYGAPSLNVSLYANGKDGVTVVCKVK